MTAHPERLYLMLVGAIMPGSVPIPCYLVQTSDGQNVLIDSGLPTEDLIPADAPPLEYGIDVIRQLAMLGLQPGDINLVVCTHFDIDHAGHNADFPNAELIVQRAHYDYALTSERVAPIRSQWDLPASRYRFIAGDLELLPGLRLISTSGHLPGHQSVLVTLPQSGGVLLTIDAVFNQESFAAADITDEMSEAQRMTQISMRKLLDLAESEAVNQVIFGHDSQQWQVLKTLPEYYA